MHDELRSNIIINKKKSCSTLVPQFSPPPPPPPTKSSSGSFDLAMWQSAALTASSLSIQPSVTPAFAVSWPWRGGGGKIGSEYEIYEKKTNLHNKHKIQSQ